MFHRSKMHGNMLPAFLSGAAGVILGACIVFLFIYIRDRIDTPNDVNTPQPPAVQETVPTPNTTAKTTIPLNDNSKPLPSGSNSVANAVAKVAPAVVNIDTTTVRRIYSYNNFGFGPSDSRLQEIPQGMGTGVIVGATGMVLTNNHVISKAKSIRVTLGDKKQYSAKVIGTDPISDLAILQIDNPDKRSFPTASLTSSQTMRIGDWVVAIGNPVGVGQTATLGVLSARGRSLSDNTVDLHDLLQTDAAINPGNSGGPLVNMNGEVIGINTAIIPYAQGIGFAIPAETAHSVIAQLQTNGHVSRPYLGIEMGDLNDSARNYLQLPQDAQGVVVGRTITGAPADKAGLTAGDVIVKINNTPTPNCKTLQALMRSFKADQKITVSIIRQTKDQQLEVQLEEMPAAIMPNR